MAVLRGWLARLLMLTGGAFILGLIVFSYMHRDDRCVLYYYGASPTEVPQGTAIPILNPFRDRSDERNAEWLIHDLRTNRCEQIVRERLQVDSNELCLVMQNGAKASLIWLDPVPDFRKSTPYRQLIYDLPESHARLVIYFSRDEDGWGVSSASIAQ